MLLLGAFTPSTLYYGLSRYVSWRGKQRCTLWACSQDSCDQWVSRRQFCFSVSTIAVPVLPGLLMSRDDFHATLSRIASKIPGFGEPDIFYPSYFLGEWEVHRELMSLKTPQGEHGVSKTLLDELSSRIGHIEEYKARFVMHRYHVIQDRAYTARYELAAELQMPLKYIEVVWDRDNPNVLSLSVPPSYDREIKVMKRAFDNERGGQGTFEEREFARIVDVFGDDRLLGQGKGPRIYGRRRVVKYRVHLRDAKDVPQVLVALGVDYGYLSQQGPDTDMPNTILKSRLLFKRQKQ